ncbi:hypothetical protein PENARI_c009G06182 [Penicillium arizonense]|uniref:Ornithine decarboxylase antizyme n=1 Tax=Penicillium arizonense TaxID=1835702 RepID=A0A1F5LHU7_PENAI|nr:hypothetical protein PENARI_c009G06182 [Penicillium arizonense]OGE52636.1 hypothetical protein PENARI_c009G06182 [Penicillium arizonense]
MAKALSSPVATVLNRRPPRFTASTTALRWAPEYSGIPEVPSGSKSALLSPPLDIPASSAERTWPGNGWPEFRGEATHTIPEECERLFCDKLSTTFLGEGSFVRQESLGMDVFQNIPNQIGQGHDRIQRWIEVWDYSGDAIYRGFVAENNGERTLFVFFEDRALDQGLKSGLIALFELADMTTFGCSQIVACVGRSERTDAMELVRSLGWCGFSLTTLEPWMSSGDQGVPISDKWLFLVAEV